MATKIQVRRGLSTEWVSVNPTLSQGEIGLETDTGNFKIGTGNLPWNSLPYSIATQTYVGSEISAHNSDTTNVHGILNTALLATLSQVDDKDSIILSAANDYTDQANSSLGNTIDSNFIPLSDLSQPDGVASLDSTGNVPLSQLGNLVDGAPLDLDTLKELADAISGIELIHPFAMIG